MSSFYGFPITLVLAVASAFLALVAAAVWWSGRRGASTKSTKSTAPATSKAGLGSKSASAACLKALAADPNKPSVRILYGTQVSG